MQKPHVPHKEFVEFIKQCFDNELTVEETFAEAKAKWPVLNSNHRRRAKAKTRVYKWYGRCDNEDGSTPKALYSNAVTRKAQAARVSRLVDESQGIFKDPSVYGYSAPIAQQIRSRRLRDKDIEEGNLKELGHYNYAGSVGKAASLKKMSENKHKK